MIVIESDTITEVITGFGMKGVSAEEVATQACDEATAYLRAQVPVGPYLADQLLVPMALARSGQFRTLDATMHARTNAAVIQRFLDVPISFEPESAGVTRVTVGDRCR
jgi:RNA 3'-terminal phosphate cyclase (ATP)